MATSAELIKTRVGNPLEAVVPLVERLASQGSDRLSEDDLFLFKWLGLYTHRHEPGYFMLRTKHPNGFVTSEQLDLIAQIAENKNRGFADITTRQDIQLHWVHYTQAAEILQQLKAGGISTMGACGDILRNVVGCPVAGVDQDEVFDASSVALAASQFFTNDPAYANLPRKYKFSIAGCRTWCSHPEIQCVSLTGASRTVNGRIEAGFDVRVGGGLSTQAFTSQRLNAFIKPEEAVEVLRHITDIWRESPDYRQKRHHARFKYLIHDWGVEKFRQVLVERMGRPLDEAPADFQEPRDVYRDHVGVHAQKQPGRFYVGAPVLVGRISSAQMKKVADLCRRYTAVSGTPPLAGSQTPNIRLTNRQNILLVNIAETHVEKVLSGLSDVGLSINAHPVRRSVVTCTGTEFCKLAITETKARSRQIVEYLEKRVPLEEPLRLHITGCPNACAQYQVAHIGLMGSKTKVDGQIVDAFDILVGGQLGQGAAFNHAILRKVPATEVARRLESLLLAYQRLRKEEETFNGWCRRAGDAELLKWLTADSAHPLEMEEAR